MKILFIHGLASSGAYKMADTMRILLRPCEVIAPDVPIDPRAALGLLKKICREENPDLIVGLSMGGFWAQKLRGYRKLLVNPDFHISVLMRTLAGEVKYLSPRLDGAESFIITEGLCDAYFKIEETQFEDLDYEEKSITFGAFATADELVRCGDEFSAHYPGHRFDYPGKHLPDYAVVKEYLIPVILKILG